MSDLESIKKAMEGLTPDRLRYEADAMFAAVQGEQYGDTFHAYNWADKPHRVLYDAINLMREGASTLESLQRENEELASGIKRLSDEEELLAETTGDMVSVVKLAAKLSLSETHVNELQKANVAYVDANTALISENERLKQDRYDLAYAITGGEDAPGLLDSVPTSQLVEIARDTHRSHSTDIDRAKAAEAEVNQLRNKVAARALTDMQLADEIEAIDEACKGGFGEGGGSPGEWWYERADELEHERKRRELESQLHHHNSRTALASTGGEHNGN